jgi:hypothetical protein
MKTELLTVYARKEPTTDVTTLKYDLKQKHFDVQIYKDEKATVPYARFPWHYKSIPTKRNKTITVNCFKWKLEWIN